MPLIIDIFSNVRIIEKHNMGGSAKLSNEWREKIKVGEKKNKKMHNFLSEISVFGSFFSGADHDRINFKNWIRVQKKVCNMSLTSDYQYIDIHLG